MATLRPPTIMMDAYSSDNDSQHQHHRIHLQRTSSSSSFCSSSSAASTASYRILPVRYSSVDRVIPQITSNEKGINVRIRFDRGKSSQRHQHHRRHRRHEEQMEEHEHRHQHQHQHYRSCPALNENNRFQQKNPSNINYIETRSIVRGHSNEYLNRPQHSSTLIIRQQSLPPRSASRPFARTTIQHLPLDTKSIFRPVITRVIREENEEERIDFDVQMRRDRDVIVFFFFVCLGF